VEVGQDVAVGADDDAGAEPGVALGLAFRAVAEEVAEDRVVEQRMALLLDFLRGVDVHDGGQGRAPHRGRSRLGAFAGGRSTAGASWKARPHGRCGSHSGLSVVTTNRMASATVTVCAKISHNLCMERPSRMKREELVRYLDGCCSPRKFRDYCPNGLQVEGRAEIVASWRCHRQPGAARCGGRARADAILVHHGWFWKGEDGRITGMRKRAGDACWPTTSTCWPTTCRWMRIPELGNNAQLARAWAGAEGVSASRTSPGSAVLATPSFQPAAGGFGCRRALGREPLVGDPKASTFVASPGAPAALRAISSRPSPSASTPMFQCEISEQTVHLARESGVAYLAGAEALAQHLAEKFGLSCEFVDIDNPV
jgi:hypothetical protein